MKGKRRHRKWLVWGFLCLCMLLGTETETGEAPFVLREERETLRYPGEEKGTGEEKGKRPSGETAAAGRSREEPSEAGNRKAAFPETAVPARPVSAPEEKESETSPEAVLKPAGKREKTETEKKEEGNTEADSTEEEKKPLPETDKNEGKYPEIRTDLQSEELIRETWKTFYVEGRDYRGKELGRENQEVYGNGTRLQAVREEEGKVYYELELKEGENTVTVTVRDEEGRETTIESVFYHGESRKTALCSLEAGTLGLGACFIGLVPFEEGESIKEVIIRGMKERGYEGICKTEGGKERESGEQREYLDRVKKPGITEGYRIPEDLHQKLEEAGYEKRGHKKDSLGTDDFSRGSGWRISVNSQYTGGMELEEEAEAGDVIRIRFTLYYGKDIQASEENWEKEW